MVDLLLNRAAPLEDCEPSPLCGSLRRHGPHRRAGRAIRGGQLVTVPLVCPGHQPRPHELHPPAWLTGRRP